MDPYYMLIHAQYMYCITINFHLYLDHTLILDYLQMMLNMYTYSQMSDDLDLQHSLHSLFTWMNADECMQT